MVYGMFDGLRRFYLITIIVACLFGAFIVWLIPELWIIIKPFLHEITK